MKGLRFYRTQEPYGNFSNFAGFPIFLKGNNWPTVEHFFQASKFADENLREKIRNLKSPMAAAMEGRKRRHPLRPDWEEVKEEVMRHAVWAKFTQHPSLRTELLQTGDAPIVEQPSNDAYWGDGGDGSGKNRLGMLLVETREELRAIHDDPDLVMPPWLAFPGIDQEDMFWRMGLGENYISKWARSYCGLDKPKEYQSRFPEPEHWRGFYEEPE